MLKKLRWQFVKAAMTAMAIVLLLLLTAVNGLNGLNVIRSMDGMLQVLEQFDGALPDVTGVGEEAAQLHVRYTEESPFETRFFIVETDADGQSMTALLDNIAAVGEESACELARQAMASGRNSGFVERYRFRCEEMADGGSRIFFLDGGVMLGSLQSLLKTSLIIYLLALLGVFAVAWLFSGHYAAPIVKTLETQRRFMADAEHELKTPLTIIAATTDVLQAELGENQWLEAITEQTGRMTELISRLLTLSRLDNGDAAAPMGTVNLSEVTERAVKQVTPVARAAGHAIRTAVAPGLCCEGCEPLMEQLLMILMDNAIQYSASQGEIEVTLQLQREHVLLRVSNAWQPDPRLDMDRLFDRFYRGDPSRSRKTGGSGLGLSIARAIVDKHHGQIAAAAEANRFVMTVRLPLGRPA
ncbi:MAG: sensor histidine kinase [Aristaeellaceae bacterium]